MTDLSKTILAKSDQLNADDLATPRTVTITGVRMLESKDQPIVINYEGDNGKPFKPCKSVRRVLVRAWGPDGSQYVGRSMTLFNDPEVKWGGQAVGGIRISHLSHIDAQELTIPLTVTRGVKKPVTIHRLEPQQNSAPETGPAARDDAIETARNAASCGTDAFRKWYNSDDGKDVRHLFKDDKKIMDELAQTAKAVDQENDANFKEAFGTGDQGDGS